MRNNINSMFFYVSCMSTAKKILILADNIGVYIYDAKIEKIKIKG